MKPSIPSPSSKTKSSSFGSVMIGREFLADTAGKYRFGMNTQEKDDEIYGDGNEMDFGARIYDGRLGRWMSLDPLQAKYPSFSPYNFAANNPIIFVDIDGREIINPYDRKTDEKNYLKVQRAIEIVKVTNSQLYNKLNESPIKININIGNLSDKINEDFTKQVGTEQITKYISDGNIDMIAGMEKPLLNPDVQYSDKQSSWYQTENNEFKSELAEAEAKASIISSIEITLDDGLDYQSSLGGVLAHELGHAEYDLDNPLDYYIYHLEGSDKSNNYKSKSENAANIRGNEFDTAYKSLGKDVKKTAEKKALE